MKIIKFLHVEVKVDGQGDKLIELEVAESNANNCINSGNNLEQFGGGGMGDPKSGEFDH